jgi:hypothetical protein
MGGLNGELIFPLKKYKNKECNLIRLKEIPQYIYMGKEDQNDAVQFDDAYNNIERNTINSTLGNNVQQRWTNCQNVYKKENILVKFITYDKVGHWTTPSINIDVRKFFLMQLQE